FVQASLKPIGIEVNLNVVARAAYLDAVRSGRHHLQFWWETGTDPGGILRILFHSSNAGGGTNRNNYKNQEMDRLIDQIDATADPQKRTELVVRAQQKVIDDAVMAYLADPPERLAQVRRVMGLNRPLLSQYADYLRKLGRGDLGRSIHTNASVHSELLSRVGSSAELAAAAFAVATALGLGLGLVSALRRGTWVDAGAMLVALGGVSMPIFWLASMLIFVFSLKLGW